MEEFPIWQAFRKLNLFQEHFHQAPSGSQTRKDPEKPRGVGEIDVSCNL